MPSRFRWKLNALRLLWISSPLIALLSYGWKIETQWFEITRSELQFPVKQAIKLAHLSDVHVFEIGEREFKTFEILHRERPDLIVITGDLISSDGNWDIFASWLKKLTLQVVPQHGTWIIQGNWEHWRPHPQLRELVEAAGGKLLRNESVKLEPLGLVLVGYDDDWLGKPEPVETRLSDEDRRHAIGLIHSPSGFRKIRPQLPLVLGGHTHGGQIRWPGGPALYFPPSSDGFDHGWYKEDRASFYVSRGVGTSTIDLRLFCRPEIHVLSLMPEGT